MVAKSTKTLKLQHSHPKGQTTKTRKYEITGRLASASVGPPEHWRRPKRENMKNTGRLAAAKTRKHENTRKHSMGLWILRAGQASQPVSKKLGR